VFILVYFETTGFDYILGIFGLLMCLIYLAISFYMLRKKKINVFMEHMLQNLPVTLIKEPKDSGINQFY